MNGSPVPTMTQTPRKYPKPQVQLRNTPYRQLCLTMRQWRRRLVSPSVKGDDTYSHYAPMETPLSEDTKTRETQKNTYLLLK